MGQQFFPVEVFKKSYNNYKCNSERTRVHMICICIINLLSSPDLCDNLNNRKIHCCGPARHMTEQECHRIFAEGNSN
jgi:hypothetical protein